jgi:hypothetical protein
MLFWLGGGGGTSCFFFSFSSSSAAILSMILVTCSSFAFTRVILTFQIGVRWMVTQYKKTDEMDVMVISFASFFASLS